MAETVVRGLSVKRNIFRSIVMFGDGQDTGLSVGCAKVLLQPLGKKVAMRDEFLFACGTGNLLTIEIPIA